MLRLAGWRAGPPRRWADPSRFSLPRDNNFSLPQPMGTETQLVPAKACHWMFQPLMRRRPRCPSVHERRANCRVDRESAFWEDNRPSQTHVSCLRASFRELHLGEGGYCETERVSVPSYNQFCFRFCKPGVDAALYCQHIYDIQGQIRLCHGQRCKLTKGL